MRVEILQSFKEIFNIKDNAIDKWFKKSKDTIEIHMKRGVTYTFTYRGKNNWRLETENFTQ